jgi:hypothetical protein
MAITPEMIQAVRFEVADSDPALPILNNDEITYLLTKNTESIRRASLDAARVIMMKLAQQGDEIVGMISIKGSKVAEQYRLALQMYLKNPQLNPVVVGLGVTTDSNGVQQAPIYAGGISNSDMLNNTSDADNNYIPNPIYQKGESKPFRGAFEV